MGKQTIQHISKYTPAPRRGRGVYCFTSLRLSVVPSVRPSVLPSFVRSWYLSSHFSQYLLTSEIWYLFTSIIEVPHIMGSAFGHIRFLLPACWLCWFLCTFNIHLYMHILRRIFLSNYWWQESDIWSEASYRYEFLNPSDSCLSTLLICMHIEHTFCNYWWQKSDIWSQA